ncbi:MAG TPA: hypothetical protein VF666_01715 [Pyrinomonadaceae bacterium]|jgi:hypothetical protein
MPAELITSLKELAAIAPLASALIFAASLGVGVYQILKNRENQRRATAIALWDKYLDRTIQYPIFAFPKRFEQFFDFDRQEIDGSPEKFEQYEWFVAALIRTSNEILGSYDKRKQRYDMVKRNIEYHKRYIAFKTSIFFKDLGPEVENIVKKIEDEYKRKIEDEKRGRLRNLNLLNKPSKVA